MKLAPSPLEYIRERPEDQAKVTMQEENSSIAKIANERNSSPGMVIGIKPSRITEGSPLFKILLELPPIGE